MWVLMIVLAVLIVLLLVSLLSARFLASSARRVVDSRLDSFDWKL
jgi:hypothetical protein